MKNSGGESHTHMVWGNLLQARNKCEAGRKHLQAAAEQFRVSGISLEPDQIALDRRRRTS
jgi:hypothetical protein